MCAPFTPSTATLLLATEKFDTAQSNYDVSTILAEPNKINNNAAFDSGGFRVAFPAKTGDFISAVDIINKIQGYIDVNKEYQFLYMSSSNGDSQTPIDVGSSLRSSTWLDDKQMPNEQLNYTEFIYNRITLKGSQLSRLRFQLEVNYL